MVGSYHNHAKQGHTQQLVKTPQHGGDKGATHDKTNQTHSPRASFTFNTPIPNKI
jgi:hypothetical protein